MHERMAEIALSELYSEMERTLNKNDNCKVSKTKQAGFSLPAFMCWGCKLNFLLRLFNYFEHLG